MGRWLDAARSSWHTLVVFLGSLGAASVRGAGRRLFAVRKSWHIWTVLFFSIGIKSLVNQVEGPFARSLVICDSPVRLDSYTGSRWCGDRLTVIQQGVEIQSKGQSQENFAMFFSLTFVVVLSGVWGAKAALVMGLLAVTSSVVLFLMACSSPRLGRSLYAVAQGLQGMYPIEYLQGIIMFHLSYQPGMDGHAIFELGSYMGIVCNFVWNIGVASLVSLLELSDYTVVWQSILGLNAVILAIAVFKFPAMMPPDHDKTSDLGPFDRLVHELSSYKDLAKDWRARRMTLKLFFENLQGPFHSIAVPSQLMAYHSWGQSQLVWFNAIRELVGMSCIPIYQGLLLKYGHHRVYVLSCKWFLLSGALKAVTLPCTGAVWAFIECSMTPLRGFEPFRGFVDSRFSEPEQMQRFQSCQWVMGYFQGIWIAPVYAHLFDAYADTYLGRFWPGLLCCAALVVHYFLVFYAIYDMDGVHGFGVTLRVLEEGGAKAAKLFDLVARDAGCIDREAWKLYNLETLLGLPWDVVGDAETVDQAHWFSLISLLNGTPRQGQEALKKLDKAIAYAHGVHHNFISTAYEQNNKAVEIWDKVAADDECISFEKWQLYKLEGLSGIEWARSGGDGIRSREQWLGLFDPWKASKESVKKMDYSIAYIEGVRQAIAKHLAGEAARASQEVGYSGEGGAEQAHPPYDEHAAAWAEGQHSWEEHAASAEGQPDWAAAHPAAEEAAWPEAQPWEEQAHAPTAADASGEEQDVSSTWCGEPTGPAESDAAEALPSDDGAVAHAAAASTAAPGRADSNADSADAVAGGPTAAAGGASNGLAAEAEEEAVVDAIALAEAVAAGAAKPAPEGKKDA